MISLHAPFAQKKKKTRRKTRSGFGRIASRLCASADGRIDMSLSRLGRRSNIKCPHILPWSKDPSTGIERVAGRRAHCKSSRKQGPRGFSRGPCEIRENIAATQVWKRTVASLCRKGPQELAAGSPIMSFNFWD